MDKTDITRIEDIRVSRIKSGNGLVGAKQAFDTLESSMHGLTGRKMYGVFYPGTKEYFACVMLDDEHPDDMGFEQSTIPGGLYARMKIIGWASKIHELGAAFRALADACVKNGHEIDPLRPSVEFYRSFTELIIMIPVRS
jgi:hypothetical protein